MTDEAAAAGKPEITYDDFQKLDLRVGKVVSVEAHPNADKLYVITVDLGTEQRQIVAGIKPYREVAQLEGLQIIVLTNLQPRKLRGVTSHGMLLAAGGHDDAPFGMLTVDTADVVPGTSIS